MELNSKTAVVLFNLGGPDSLEAVKPFLFNLFNDKAIISIPQPFRFLLAKFISSKRYKKTQNSYAKIGGKSPLLEFTERQAYALEKELSFSGNYKVFTAMRYWKPLAQNVVLEVLKYAPDRLILLPLYPQFSSSTSASSIQDFVTKFLSKFKQANKKIKTKVICCYPAESDFIKSHSLLIKQTIGKSYDYNSRKFRFLFSAHGLPQKIIDKGDPYVFQVEETAKKIVENLANIFVVDESEIDFKVCYQSKVGPLHWTSPSLDQELRSAILDDKIPVIVPVSFVSDHLETLVELDIDYKEMAENFGAKDYLRVPALNADGHFIKSLVTICKNANDDDQNSIFSGTSSVRICPKNMQLCLNKNTCAA